MGWMVMTTLMMMGFTVAIPHLTAFHANALTCKFTTTNVSVQILIRKVLATNFSVQIIILT